MILEKLGATDRAEAVSRGFELGIFSPPNRRDDTAAPGRF
jgi:hypothetical protein